MNADWPSSLVGSDRGAGSVESGPLTLEEVEGVIVVAGGDMTDLEIVGLSVGVDAEIGLLVATVLVEFGGIFEDGLRTLLPPAAAEAYRTSYLRREWRDEYVEGRIRSRFCLERPLMRKRRRDTVALIALLCAQKYSTRQEMRRGKRY